MIKQKIVSFGNNLYHPFLDRGETKTFINNVIEYYNISSLEEYKTSPKQPHLKIIHKILSDNNASQDIVDNLLVERKIEN